MIRYAALTAAIMAVSISAMAQAITLGSYVGKAATLSTQSCQTVAARAQVLLVQQRNVEAENVLHNYLIRSDSDQASVCRGALLAHLEWVLFQLGKMDEAERTAKESVRLLELAEGDSAPLLRQPLVILAQLAFSKGNIRQAYRLLARSNSLAGATHSDLAASHALKGSLLLFEKRLDEAEAEFRQSLAERVSAGEEQSLFAVPEHLHLAVIYLNRDQLTDALAEIECVPELIKHSPYNPELAVDASLLLALTQARLHRPDEAEHAFASALAGVPDLPLALQGPLGRNVYLQFASFRRKAGHKTEAKELLREANAMFGPDRSSLTVSVNSLLTNGQ